MLKIPKKGSAVIVQWLDAVFYQYTHDVDLQSYNRGGDILTSIGFIVNYNEKSMLLAAELDEEGKPSRDINLIPMCLITKIEVLKK